MPKHRQPTPPLHLYPLPPLAPTDGVGPGVGQAFVRAYFPRVQQGLRIATAYFNIKGYRMALPHLPPGIKVKILVGERDGYQVQSTVLEELKAELEQGVKLASLYEAVADLYQRMVTGELTICDARRIDKPFHCKIYIIDKAGLFHGSANFSANGLKGQAEQLTYSTNRQLVADWTTWFEEVAANSLDLQTDLRQLLADWLQLATPFQIYLRALELLLDPARAENLQGGAHAPVPYQRALASWAARQLTMHRGAVLVVATGLGKTVIGAEAVMQRWRSGQIERILIIAPPSVQKAWDIQLQGRGLRRGQHFAQFGLKALFRVKATAGGQTEKLLEELAQAGPGTLLLIDEAHEYRNQQQAIQAKLPSKAKQRDNRSSGSLVFDRLLPALEAGIQVLLLTGSAYGTNNLNLSSLLKLLPTTNPQPPIISNPVLPLSGTPTPTSYPWVATSASTFGALPVVAVFTYPHALYLIRQAQPPATSDTPIAEAAASPFLPFAHGPGYLPLGIHSELVHYNLPCWSELLEAFDSECFAQDELITTEGFIDEVGSVIGKTDVVGNHALSAWLSSPAALHAAIMHNLATTSPSVQQTALPFTPQTIPLLSPTQTEQLPIWEQVIAETNPSKNRRRPLGTSYNTFLRLTQEERQLRLTPISNLLKSASLVDPKLTALSKIVHDLCVVNSGQLIVFVRQRLTAVYLEKKLKTVFKLKVACTVAKNGELKSAAERETIRKKFAPIAHNEKGPPYYRVLICTDADSLGVNLQDAGNVANYDWPSSADGLIQRLGRILRPAPYAGRIPRVYTFVPECLHASHERVNASHTMQSILHQYNRLLSRRLAATELLGFPILNASSEPHIPLDTGINAEALADKLAEETDGLSTVSNSWVAHIETLDKHRHLLRKLSGKPIHSARLWSETHPQVVVILRHPAKGIVPIVYDLLTEKPRHLHDLPMLNLLRAEVNERPAGVNLPRIMGYADVATKWWCKRNKIKPSSTKRLLALYLHPQHQAENFDYLLSTEQ